MNQKPQKHQNFCQYLSESQLYETEAGVVTHFDELVDDVHDWLYVHNFKQAEVVMDLVLDLKKDKTRKDRKTPSALHEITQALWLISMVEEGLPVDDVEGVLSAIFVHDLGEDFGVTPRDLEQHLLENGIKKSKKTERLKKDLHLLSKCYGRNGEPKDKDEYNYYLGIQESPNASIVKMLDKAHNIMTLIGLNNLKQKERAEKDHMLITEFKEILRNLKKYSKEDTFFEALDRIGEIVPLLISSGVNSKVTHEKLKMMLEITKTHQLFSDFTDYVCEKFPSQADTYKALKHLSNEETQTSRYYVVWTGKKIPDDANLKSEMPKTGFNFLPLGLHPLIVPANRIRKTYLDNNFQKSASHANNGKIDGDNSHPSP